MNICFVCSEYPPGPHGGIGTVTRTLSRALVGAGHEVRVIGIYPPDYPAPDSEDDQGVRVWRIRENTRRGGWLVSRYELYRRVARWARGGEVDVVEGPDYCGPFAGWPSLPVPVVQRVHGSASYFAHELGRAVDPTMFRIERWSFRRATTWTSVSQYTASITQQLFGLREGPAEILYNPVDFPADAPPFSRRSPNRVVYGGTLTPKKGIFALIDAWPGVRAACPEAELHLYGKDTRSPTGESIREQLVERIPEGLRGSIVFHGHVGGAELREALSTARVGVFPSYSEAFALAPLESMGCGCPTISTKLSSGPEGVRSEIDGLLVDPGRPAEISDAIVRLLRDDSLAERVGRAGRARVLQDFSLDALLAANEKFFHGAVQASTDRRGRAA